MADLIVILATGALMIVLALVLLTGRGSFLIAGFNTMSKEGKAKYDAEALCKFLGKILLPIGILIPFLAIESIVGWYAWVCTAAILGLCIFAVVYVNRGNRFKK